MASVRLEPRRIEADPLGHLGDGKHMGLPGDLDV